MSNSVTLVGNITKEPELRYTNNGTPKITLGLAVNRRWQNRLSGEWEEAVSFFNVVVWGDLAENVGASLFKGARVIVTGRLDQRTYQTDMGEQRSTVEVIAEDIGPSLRRATVEVRRVERHAA
jgi:single-strand DNA-binding protein